MTSGVTRPCDLIFPTPQPDHPTPSPYRRQPHPIQISIASTSRSSLHRLPISVSSSPPPNFRRLSSPTHTHTHTSCRNTKSTSITSKELRIGVLLLISILPRPSILTYESHCGSTGYGPSLIVRTRTVAPATKSIVRLMLLDNTSSGYATFFFLYLDPYGLSHTTRTHLIHVFDTRTLGPDPVRLHHPRNQATVFYLCSTWLQACLEPETDHAHTWDV